MLYREKTGLSQQANVSYIRMWGAGHGEVSRRKEGGRESRKKRGSEEKEGEPGRWRLEGRRKHTSWHWFEVEWKTLGAAECKDHSTEET